MNLRDSANTDSWKNLKEKNKGKKSIANMTNLLRIFLTRLMVNMNWSIDNEVETTNHVDINMSEDGKSDVLDSADNDCSKALNVSDEIDSKDVLDLSSNSEEGLVRRENFDKLNYPTDIDDESEKDNLPLKKRILGSNKEKTKDIINLQEMLNLLLKLTIILMIHFQTLSFQTLSLLMIIYWVEENE